MTQPKNPANPEPPKDLMIRYSQAYSRRYNADFGGDHNTAVQQSNRAGCEAVWRNGHEAGRASMAGEVAEWKALVDQNATTALEIFCDLADAVHYGETRDAEIAKLRAWQAERNTRDSAGEFAARAAIDAAEARAEKAEAEIAELKRDLERTEANYHTCFSRAEKAEGELAGIRNMLGLAPSDVPTNEQITWYTEELDRERTRRRLAEDELARLRADSFAAAAAECKRLAKECQGEDAADQFWSRAFWQQAAEEFAKLASQLPQPAEAQWERKNRGITLTLSEEGDYVTRQYWVVRGPDFSHSGPSPAVALRWCAEFLDGRPLPASLQAILDRNWPKDGTEPGESQPAEAPGVFINEQTEHDQALRELVNRPAPPYETRPRLEKDVEYAAPGERGRGAYLNAVERKSQPVKKATCKSCGNEIALEGWYHMHDCTGLARVVRVEPEPVEIEHPANALAAEALRKEGVSVRRYGKGWLKRGLESCEREATAVQKAREPEKCERCGGACGEYDGAKDDLVDCPNCNGTGEKGGGK